MLGVLLLLLPQTKDIRGTAFFLWKEEKETRVLFCCLVGLGASRSKEEEEEEARFETTPAFLKKSPKLDIFFGKEKLA